MAFSLSAISTISYGVGALAFLALTLVLATGWRGRREGALLVAASALTAVWAGVLAFEAHGRHPDPAVLQIMEALRDLGWIAALLGILRQAHGSGAPARWLRAAGATLITLVFLTVVFGVFAATLESWGLPSDLDGRALLAASLLVSVGMLWLVEALFRSTRADRRWAVKFLCLGVGALFAYDLFMYSHALLFQQVDPALWSARGVVDALAVPLIAVAAARNPEWSLDVFVSRGVVLHSVTLVGAGIYLLVMAAAGYYIQMFGGEWGPVLQVIFLAGAGVLLLMLLFSGQVRARLKVFLSKHFFNYRYDYREEWLRFTQTLSRCQADAEPRECAIRAMAALVESPGGMLWMRGGAETLTQVAAWNMPHLPDAVVRGDSPLARFLAQREWVINLDEHRASPDVYDGLELPDWLREQPDAWVVVPLIDQYQLRGFMLLSQPRADMAFDWEVRDLLKTAGRQAASYLAQLDAMRALAEARQFEGFHRLSALLLHDLKNLIAQQSLVVRSAPRHRENPAFLDDAVKIMAHSVDKMNRLMNLLRTGLSGAKPEPVELQGALAAAVASRARSQPEPELRIEGGPLWITADRERLVSVVGNLIQNAQEATGKDGFVRVGLVRHGACAVITVEDNGSGMDPAFIRDRLFRPFYTTKGDTGMGIGAYESRAYVHELGGDLRVSSSPGQGSCFRVELPLAAQTPTPAEPTGYRENAG